MNRDRKEIVPDPELEIRDFEVMAIHRDRHRIPVRSYRRVDMEESRPALIYMHGGGFVTGSLETDDRTCRAVSRALNLVVFSIEYRLAPEHPFPIGFEDCWDVLEYITHFHFYMRFPNLGKGLLLGGTSAGGNFTAGLAHRYNQYWEPMQRPPITGLLFLASSFCHPDVRPDKYRERISSVDEIDDAPGLTKSSIDHFWKQYGAPKDDKRYSPLLNEDWKGVALRAFFSICGWDPRRDEALLFADILDENGVEVKKEVYPGLPHGFWTTCPDLSVSTGWELDTIMGIKWLLEHPDAEPKITF